MPSNYAISLSGEPFNVSIAARADTLSEQDIWRQTKKLQTDRDQKEDAAVSERNAESFIKINRGKKLDVYAP